MGDSVFTAVAASFFERELPRPTRRDVALPGLPGKADALVGMRRVGKTWRLFQHLHERLDDGVPRERLLYVNFEDERIDLEATDLGGLLDAWYARYPDVPGGPHWLYLDEVQNVPGWERFVRRLLDEGQVRVLVTGSSSRLLSEEIATSLRGRALTTEVLPFSLGETLRHAGALDLLDASWPLGPQARARLVHAWQRYLETGGFPEVQGLETPLRRRVLQEYVDVAILRDIVERHGVTQVHALRWLVRRFLANPAGRFTLNKLHRDLRSQGLGVGKATLAALVDHIQDAHIAHVLQLWTPSAARRSTNPSKAYPVDPALSRTAAFAKPGDLGHHLETLVYLHLRRRGWSEVGYLVTQEGFEVDFCGRDAWGRPQLVQVCADLADPRTRERELRALDAAMAEQQVPHATLVTAGLGVVPPAQEETLAVTAGSVRVAPAWRWLLESDTGP